MSPFPTVDPSASLSAWQAYAVARDAWVGDGVLLVVVALVLGIGVLVFSLGALLVPAVVRR